MRPCDWLTMGIVIGLGLGIAMCLPGCGGVDYSLAPVEIVAEDLLACREIDLTAKHFTCYEDSDREMAMVPVEHIDWHLLPGSEVWRRAVWMAMTWWGREIGLTHQETVDQGLAIGWHPETYPGIAAHAHRDVDVDGGCVPMQTGYIRIDPTFSDIWDDVLIAHEIGHTLGYRHQTGTVMDPMLHGSRAACGRGGE